MKLMVLAALAAAACEPHRFTAAVIDAEEMQLYEGLPHQSFEPALLESERRDKRVMELDGHWFYAELLAPSAEDVKRLTRIFSDPRTFAPYIPDKLCGGFHPDYAADWTAGDRSYMALICLGCDEVRLIGPRGVPAEPGHGDRARGAAREVPQEPAAPPDRRARARAVARGKSPDLPGRKRRPRCDEDA